MVQSRLDVGAFWLKSSSFSYFNPPSEPPILPVMMALFGWALLDRYGMRESARLKSGKVTFFVLREHIHAPKAISYNLPA